jgi:hypothetical protein
MTIETEGRLRKFPSMSPEQVAITLIKVDMKSNKFTDFNLRAFILDVQDRLSKHGEPLDIGLLPNLIGNYLLDGKRTVFRDDLNQVEDYDYHAEIFNEIKSIIKKSIKKNNLERK